MFLHSRQLFVPFRIPVSGILVDMVKANVLDHLQRMAEQDNSANGADEIGKRERLSPDELSVWSGWIMSRDLNIRSMEDMQLTIVHN